MHDGSVTVEHRKRDPMFGASGGAKLGRTVAECTAVSSSVVPELAVSC